MGQIVKQPDGRYAVWSSIVGNFSYTDCTEEELIKSLWEDELENIKDTVKRAIKKINTGKTNQFAMTYEDCLKEIKRLKTPEGEED